MADIREIQVGDNLTMLVPVRRKWWRFWEVKWQTETRSFLVESVVRGNTTMYIGPITEKH
jgi:hypothetical protein